MVAEEATMVVVEWEEGMVVALKWEEGMVVVLQWVVGMVVATWGVATGAVGWGWVVEVDLVTSTTILRQPTPPARHW